MLLVFLLRHLEFVRLSIMRGISPSSSCVEECSLIVVPFSGCVGLWRCLGGVSARATVLPHSAGIADWVALECGISASGTHFIAARLLSSC